jgi:hypothetical protein
MKKYYIIYWAVIAICIIIGQKCQAQLKTNSIPVRERVYSSWSSAQVKHAVETEKPTFKRDTLVDISGARLEDKFIYKGFTIYLEGGRELGLTVITGNNIIMLKPDDEYEIIEKLLTLIK